MPPKTRYARHGQLSIAYQTFGRGEHHIVSSPSFVSHLDLLWANPLIRAFYDRLGNFARVTIFDKVGTGLSDPISRIPTIEDRATEIETVMDTVGAEQAALLGTSEGGPMAMYFAATRPERTTMLALFGTFAMSFDLEFLARKDVDLDAYRADLVERGWEADQLPNDEQIARMSKFIRHVFEDWGEGKALKTLIPHLGDEASLGTLERLCASPSMARATLISGSRLDVSHVLEAIQAPTVVIHARDDLVPIQAGRVIARRIADAKLIEIDGADHAPWLSRPEAIVGELEEVLTGKRQAPRAERVLATVLFTDIVDSTQRAAQIGDERWRALLERHDEVTREHVSRFGGSAVKSTGDGVLATFEGPAAALRAAEALRDALDSESISIRAGLHTGEVERMADDIGGLAVHIAARVAALAAPGEVLVSRTVPDLVVGSGFTFDERGTHQMKGVPGSWQLFALAHAGIDGDPRTLDPIASHREGQRAGDRALAAMARFTPALSRRLIRRRSRGLAT